MTEETIKTIVVAALVALPPTLLGIAAILKITKVHKELNSRLTEWKAETKKAADLEAVAEKAKGRLEGAAEQKLVSLKEHKEGAD